MAFNIRSSQIVALAIAAGIGGWIYTGSIVVGGQPSGEGIRSIAERESERDTQLFKVRYKTVEPVPYGETLSVRGQTTNAATVQIRAQVSGTLIERHVNKGDRVSENQLVCSIETGARAAQLAKSEAMFAQAQSDYEANSTLVEKGIVSKNEALFAQAQADYEANSTLVEKGIVSKNKLKSLKASLDAATAAIAEATLQLERSEIHANASGIVQDPIAEIGETLSVGSVCVTLVQSDPIKFAGQISERDIDKVKVGAQAIVKLISGMSAEGTVSYISPSADSSTRTFLTEIEIPNSSEKIRSGMTARANIKLPVVEAYPISPSWVTLADSGALGVRVVGENSMVEFVELELIAQTQSGFWVTGLKPGTKVITLGQNYVVAQEKVSASVDTLQTAGTSQ